MGTSQLLKTANKFTSKNQDLLKQVCVFLSRANQKTIHWKNNILFILRRKIFETFKYKIKLLKHISSRRPSTFQIPSHMKIFQDLRKMRQRRPQDRHQFLPICKVTSRIEQKPKSEQKSLLSLQESSLNNNFCNSLQNVPISGHFRNSILKMIVLNQVISTEC